MNECPRPLDPIDCEALASGDEPVFRPAAEAAEHISGCPSCAEGVERARLLLGALDSVDTRTSSLSAASAGNASGAPADLATRVIRLRPFSRREKRSLTLWGGPAAFGLAVLGAGLGVLAAPGLAARDQAGLGVALLASTAGLARAFVRSLADAAASAPGGWQALADAARGQAMLGLASLLLLAPAGFGLKRVLARAARRG